MNMRKYTKDLESTFPSKERYKIYLLKMERLKLIALFVLPSIFFGIVSIFVNISTQASTFFFFLFYFVAQLTTIRFIVYSTEKRGRHYKLSKQVRSYMINFLEQSDQSYEIQLDKYKL